MLRFIFFGKPSSNIFRNFIVTLIVILNFVISSMFFLDITWEYTDYIMYSVLGIPIYFLITFTIGKRVRKVKKVFSKDIVKDLSWKNLDKLYSLTFSQNNNLFLMKKEEIIGNLDELYLENLNKPYFKYKPVTLTEIILFLLGGFILYPIFFLFQKGNSRDVKIGVKPEDLGAFKLLTILTFGLYWVFLRFFAKECPICHCRNCIEPIKEDILSSNSNTEEYVENVVTEHKNKQGETFATSHTPTTKYRVKTVVLKDVHYQCLNCYGYEDIQQEKEVNY